MPVSLGLSIMHLAINGGSCDTFPGFDHLVEWLTELRESLIYVYWFFCIIKDMMKGYRWTVKMNMYLGWGLEESQTQELLSPWSWAAPPPAHRCGHPAGSSQNPVPAGIVWRLQPTDMMDHYLNLPHLSPSWRMGCGAKFQVSNTFWWPTTDLKPSRVTSSGQMTLLSPRKSKGLRSSVSAARVKDQTLEQKILLVLLSLRKAHRL